MTTPTRDGLVALAHHFFPVGLTFDDPGYFDSPEYRRYAEAWKKAMNDTRWDPLHEALQREFPETITGELTVPHHDAARRFAIYLNKSPLKDGVGDILIGCVSVVAPFYFLYGAQRRFKGGQHQLPYSIFLDTLPDNMLPYARAAAQQIEQRYNYHLFPSEYLHTPVPDISVSDVFIGNMTLLNAFFTTGLDRIP
jgi:hypothetical protein